jgi:hypothetical protein
VRDQVASAVPLSRSRGGHVPRQIAAFIDFERASSTACARRLERCKIVMIDNYDNSFTHNIVQHGELARRC